MAKEEGVGAKRLRGERERDKRNRKAMVNGKGMGWSESERI